MARVTELVFRANNRSVIRALTEISDKSSRTASTISRDSKKQAGSFNEVGKSAGRLHGIVSGLAGTVGLGGLAFGIKDVVTAGMRWQTQQTQLQGALRNTGQAGADASKRLNEAAESLASHGGFGAVENTQALTQLVTTTRSVPKAIRDVTLATDIARRTGKDYSTTVRAIMMLENGRTTGLARLGIAIPKVTTAQDKLHAQYKTVPRLLLAQAKAQDAASSKQQALATLQARYAGATDRFSKTTAGRISNMKNAWKSLQEQLGAGLLPIMNRVVTVVANLVGWLNRHRAVLYGLLAATALVTGILTTHAIITEVVKAKTYALAGAQRLLGLASGEAAAGEEGATGATVGLGAAMDALPILALIAGVVLIATHFKETKRVVVDMWQGISSAASQAWRWISGVFTGIGHAASSVVSTLGNIFKGIYDAITWPFREAWKVIQGIFHKITSIPSMIGHAAGSVLHTLSFGLLHTGGVVKPKYMAVGGPVGTDTVPGWLTPGEGVVNQRGMSVLGAQGLNALNSGQRSGGGNVIVEPMPVLLMLDGRVLTQTVVKFTQKAAARGPSSLVGGAMLTGSRTG